MCTMSPAAYHVRGASTAQPQGTMVYLGTCTNKQCVSCYFVNSAIDSSVLDKSVCEGSVISVHDKSTGRSDAFKTLKHKRRFDP